MAARGGGSRRLSGVIKDGAMPPVPPRRRRARPVADAPIDVLLSRSEDLTKGWLLALLEDAPLDDAPAILAVDLTRDGPRLCAAVLRAVTDDTDLRRLEPGGALTGLAGRAGELAGATTPAAASRAVDALQGVIWGALRDELRRPDADLVSALAERLAHVAERLRVAALERVPDVAGDDRPRRRPAAPGLAVVPDPVAPAPIPGAPAGLEPAGEPPRVLDTDGGDGGDDEEPADGDRPPALPATWPPADDADPGGPEALWAGALEDEIARAQVSGSPLALLLAELEDGGRVVAVESSAEAGATFGSFARAVRTAVRRSEILACESDTRAWIIAPDTPRPGARALAQRIALAVEQAPPWRGAPLVASIGVAVLGEDGTTVADLIAAAEEERFRASAAGRDLAPASPECEI